MRKDSICNRSNNENENRSDSIMITVKGGIVQGVYRANGEEFEDYEIIDYDVEIPAAAENDATVN